MEHKIKTLEELKGKLCNWKAYDETQLQKLMTAFEKFPRKEFSLSYVPILVDKSFIENIVEIGETYQANSSILINVISSLGNIVKRYGLNPSSGTFELFKKAMKNKKANYYASLHISSFPQYRTWEDKWNYLLSIPKIAPKKKSMVNFHGEIKQMLGSKDVVPLEFIKETIAIQHSHIGSAELSEYSKDEYSNTINTLISKLHEVSLHHELT